MGSCLRCKPRGRVASEKPYRNRLPTCSSRDLFGVHSSDLLRAGVETASAAPRPRHHPIDCSAVAYSRHASESTLLQLYDEERCGRIPRFSLVFLHQRTTPSVPQPSLSARLQHGAAPLFLVAQPGLALPLERISAGSHWALLPIH